MKRIFSLLTLLAVIFAGPSLAIAKKKINKPTERAVYHNNQGVISLNGGDLQRAEFEFKTAIELSSQYVEAYNNLGIVEKTKGNFSEAIRNFQRAISLDKKYAAAYIHLGTVYFAQGQLDEAVAIIRKGLKQNNTLADGHYNLGLVYLEKARRLKDREIAREAEGQFKKATELNPNLVYVHELLGDVYRDVGELELASIRYRLALGDEPRNEKLWVKLGNLYLQMEDKPRAANCFQKILELNASSVEGHMQMGLYLLEQGKLVEAHHEFFSVVTLNPMSELGWYRLGLVEFTQEQYDEAEKNFRKALEINPLLADAGYNLGLVALKQERYDVAKKAWQEVLKSNANHARTLYNLGVLHQLLGEKSQSTTYLCRFLNVAGSAFIAEQASARKMLPENASCPK